MEITAKTATSVVTDSSNNSQSVQDTSTEYGFKWKIIPLAIGVIAAISLIAVSILLTQNLQLYLGITLLVSTSVGLYLACTENTELGDLEQKFVSLKADLKKTTEEFEEAKIKCDEAKTALQETLATHKTLTTRITELSQKKEALKTTITVLGKQNPDANKMVDETLNEKKNKKSGSKGVTIKDPNDTNNTKKTGTSSTDEINK